MAEQMNTKSFLVAANWKLNKSPGEAEQFFREFLTKVKAEEQPHFLFFPPAVDLAITSQCLRETQIGWGAQNVYHQNDGAFTGETSPLVIKLMGATHALIGHSERRQLFKEDNELIAQKLRALQTVDLTPVLCVGELLEQREHGQTEDVLREQLTGSLRYVDWEKPLIIAYEPVWAIGTGKVASPEQAEEAHQMVRSCLVTLAGKSLAIPILYGGSVKADNARELAKQPSIDGFLVGGASLSVDSFLGIFQNAVHGMA